MDVPELVLINVFNNLPLCDQLAARLVCKQWQQLIEENLAHSARELILFANVRPHPLIWHHNDQPVNLNNSLIVNPKIKEARLFRELFRNIRRLYIVYCVCRRVHPSEIKDEISNLFNDFSGLENLEVYDWCSWSLQINFRVTLDFELPNLKTLFCDANVQTSSLIASPRLEQLAFYGDFHLDSQLAFLKSSLKLLKVFSFSHERGIGLPNLEVLYFHGTLQIELVKFKMLRKVYFANSEVNRNQNELLRLARTAFTDLFEQKQRLERNDLLVYFEGIRCEASSFSEITSQLRSFMGGPLRVLIRPSDLESFRLNVDHFQVRNLRLYFEYRSEFDDVLTALGDEQVERLARSLHTLTLADQLNDDLLRSSRFKALFRYVQRLYIDDERFFQLDVLPDILPNLVRFGMVRHPPVGQFYYHTRSQGASLLPAGITSKLKALKYAAIWGNETSPNGFKQILDNCRFFTTLMIRTGRYKAELIRWNSFCRTLLFCKQVPCDIEFDQNYIRCKNRSVNVSTFSNQQIADYLDQRKFFDEDSIETVMSSYDFSPY